MAGNPDNRQCGIRHFGMKVADIDAWTGRLKAAGLRFDVDPVDAFGEVRIAFFFDPDGAYLELIQGYVQHNNLWAPALAQQEIDADRDWDGSPRFDHIALTVPDLTESMDLYQNLGFAGVGQLVRPAEPSGFLITNLRRGPVTLELFTFHSPFARPTPTASACGRSACPDSPRTCSPRAPSRSSQVRRAGRRATACRRGCGGPARPCSG